jgi:hypothetical protein
VLLFFPYLRAVPYYNKRYESSVQSYFELYESVNLDPSDHSVVPLQATAKAGSAKFSATAFTGDHPSNPDLI